MNRFLTPLTNAILARKGYIDKYMGDAIMAFWNAPLDDKQHQLNACNAAIDMLEKIDELNKVREVEAADGGQAFIPINVGVGLNTGVCTVGNMGSDVKFNYSVLGDSVNLASRLEGQTKEYGFPIIVGSKTALAVKDEFAILELDFIMVKGKKEPEVIYAIAGREDVAQSERFQRLRNLTIEMLACYRSRDWDGALAAIERGRKTDEARSLELLYELYEERINDYKQNPPPGRLERRVSVADEVAAANRLGWAKRSVPTITSTVLEGGHASLCPPYASSYESRHRHAGAIRKKRRPAACRRNCTSETSRAATGRTVHTIRWYERQGLIPGVCRDGGGRRVYSNYPCRLARFDGAAALDRHVDQGDA